MPHDECQRARNTDIANGTRRAFATTVSTLTPPARRRFSVTFLMSTLAALGRLVLVLLGLVKVCFGVWQGDGQHHKVLGVRRGFWTFRRGCYGRQGRESSERAEQEGRTPHRRRHTMVPLFGRQIPFDLQPFFWISSAVMPQTAVIISERLEHAQYPFQSPGRNAPEQFVLELQPKLICKPTDNYAHNQDTTGPRGQRDAPSPTRSPRPQADRRRPERPRQRRSRPSSQVRRVSRGQGHRRQGRLWSQWYAQRMCLCQVC